MPAGVVRIGPVGIVQGAMKILFCDTTFPAARETLARHLPADVVVGCAASELGEAIVDAEVAIPTMARLDVKTIARGERLRLIHQYGVGLEGVDLVAARARGIPVARVPSRDSGNAIAVGELTLFLMLGLARDYGALRESMGARRLGEPMGATLYGKRAGIVGMGNLGRAIGERLGALGMEVWGIRRSPEAGGSAARVVGRLGGPGDLASMLGWADFVVVALPLSEETEGLIGEEALRAMRPSAYLINVGRGPVVAYGALLQALREGWIAGAGLDVYWEEPADPADPIFAYNVMATPHIAGATDYSYELMAQALAANVERLRRGEPLLHRVC